MLKKMPKTIRGKFIQKQSNDCLFCNVGDDDELHLGKLYKLGDISVHYYCLLFSSGLLQSGETDDKGILGFMPKDIRKEWKRGQRLKCSYCKKGGATIGCICKRCHRNYHLPCGLKQHVMLQFYDKFPAYCLDHRINQTPLEGNWEGLLTCAICMDDVVTKVTPDTLYPPCCSNGWFHKDCLQKSALNSGYFFRCPLCNNKEDFQSQMQHFGIYIPEQDAAWEREQGAFSELYERHGQCDALDCLCPGGRKQDDDCNKYQPRSNWDLILCTTCGSQGIHIGCGNLTLNHPVWECPGCQSIIRKKSPVKKKLRRKAHSPRYNSSIYNSPTINREGGETQVNSTSGSENRRHKMRRKKLVLPPSTSSDSSCSEPQTPFIAKENPISKTPLSEQRLDFRMRDCSNSNSMLTFRENLFSSSSEQSDSLQEVVPNLNTNTSFCMKEPATFSSNSSTPNGFGGLQVKYNNSLSLTNTYFLSINPKLNSNKTRTIFHVESTDEEDARPVPVFPTLLKTVPQEVTLSSDSDASNKTNVECSLFLSSDSDSSKETQVSSSLSPSKVVPSRNEARNLRPKKRQTISIDSDSTSNEELIVPDVIKKARVSPRDEKTHSETEEHAHSRQISILKFMGNNSQSGKDIFVPATKTPRKRDHQKTINSFNSSVKITSYFSAKPSILILSDEDEKT